MLPLVSFWIVWSLNSTAFCQQRWHLSSRIHVHRCNWVSFIVEFFTSQGKDVVCGFVAATVACSLVYPIDSTKAGAHDTSNIIKRTRVLRIFKAPLDPVRSKVSLGSLWLRVGLRFRLNVTRTTHRTPVIAGKAASSARWNENSCTVFKTVHKLFEYGRIPIAVSHALIP